MKQLLEQGEFSMTWAVEDVRIERSSTSFMCDNSLKTLKAIHGFDRAELETNHRLEAR